MTRSVNAKLARGFEVAKTEKRTPASTPKSIDRSLFRRRREDKVEGGPPSPVFPAGFLFVVKIPAWHRFVQILENTLTAGTSVF